MCYYEEVVLDCYYLLGKLIAPLCFDHFITKYSISDDIAPRHLSISDMHNEMLCNFGFFECNLLDFCARNGQSILSPIITHAVRILVLLCLFIKACRTTTLSNLFTHITFLKAFWLSKKKWVGILGFWTSGEMCGAQTRELFYKTIKPLSITSDER